MSQSIAAAGVGRRLVNEDRMGSLILTTFRPRL